MAISAFITSIATADRFIFIIISSMTFLTLINYFIINNSNIVFIIAVNFDIYYFGFHFLVVSVTSRFDSFSRSIKNLNNGAFRINLKSRLISNRI